MESFGIKLLADLINWEESDVENALVFINDYRLAIREKKSGGIRKTYGPHKDMKRLQRTLLKRFFYQIPLISHKRIFGFVPKKSYKGNALFHCRPSCEFFLRLDLKNAFPTVKKKDLEKTLEEIFTREVKWIQEENFLEIQEKKLTPETSSLFPWRKVRWFRKMISKKDDRVSLVLEQFLSLVLKIVTYRNMMAQGIPTSSWLLNITLDYSGVLEKLQNFLREKDITVDGKVFLSLYADDFTITSDRFISWHLRQEIIKLIEENSIFKINRRKTIYSSRKRIAPLITGLRVVEMPNLEIEKGLTASKELANGLGIKDEELEKMLVKRKKELTQNTRLEPRVPKKQIRKIRGLIHLAGGNEENYKTLKNIIDGHLANLHHIYGDNLPNQLKKPLKKYMAYKRG